MIQKKADHTTEYSQHLSTSFWVAIGSGSLLVLGVIITSNVIIIGDRLDRVSSVLSNGFYVLIIVLLYLLLVRPLIPILRTPKFNLNQILNEDDTVPIRKLRAVSRSLLKGDILPEQLRSTLSLGLHDSNQLPIAIKNALEYKLSSSDELIKERAKLCFLSTAISQNGSLDSVMLLYINIKLIGELVGHFGFRPSLPHLLRMYGQVLTAALIAERIEDMDFQEVLPQMSASLGGGIASWAGMQVLAVSMLQGMGSAYFTLRTGYLAQDYILSGGQDFDKRIARKSCTKRAAKQLIPVVASAVAKLPGSVRSVLKPFSWLFRETAPPAHTPSTPKA